MPAGSQSEKRINLIFENTRARSLSIGAKVLIELIVQGGHPLLRLAQLEMLQLAGLSAW